MQWAVGSGLIQGSGNALTPQANASRAQIATILMRFAQSNPANGFSRRGG